MPACGLHSLCGRIYLTRRATSDSIMGTCHHHHHRRPPGQRRTWSHHLMILFLSSSSSSSVHQKVSQRWQQHRKGLLVLGQRARLRKRLLRWESFSPCQSADARLVSHHSCFRSRHSSTWTAVRSTVISTVSAAHLAIYPCHRGRGSRGSGGR